MDERSSDHIVINVSKRRSMALYPKYSPIPTSDTPDRMEIPFRIRDVNNLRAKLATPAIVTSHMKIPNMMAKLYIMSCSTLYFDAVSASTDP